MTVPTATHVPPHHQPLRSLTANMNGITIAYLMGFVNAALATVAAYGVTLTPEETATTAGLVNAALVLAVHVGHRVGEGVASGTSHATAVARNDELITKAENGSQS